MISQTLKNKIKNLDKKWSLLGWGLLFVPSIVFILGITLLVAAVATMPGTDFSLNDFSLNNPINLSAIIGAILLGILFASLLTARWAWFILDVSYQKNSWVWLLAIFLFGILSWPLLFFYLLLGRKKKISAPAAHSATPEEESQEKSI